VGDVGIKKISNAAQMMVQTPKAEALRESFINHQALTSNESIKGR
jgi:hypothetical protein